MILSCLFIFGRNRVYAQYGTLYQPIPIQVNPCGTTTFTDYQNTVGGYSSFGYPSPDICYIFALSTASDVVISLCGSDFDTYLHLLNDSYNEIDYSDIGPMCPGTTNASLVEQQLPAGIYYIVAEGYGYNSGNLAVSVYIPEQ